MTILIFANGEIADVAWIRPFLPKASLVMAADGGSRHLYRLNWHPDLVVGDMDSVSPEILDWLENADVPIRRHDPVKDETDLELALLHAREYGEQILLFGTLGGRLDHMLANVLLLAHPSLAASDVQLVEERERAWLVRDRSQFKAEPGDVVSLIPVGGDVRVRETEGLRWSLLDSVLDFGLVRGLSNEVTAVSVSIEVVSGTLLCVHQTTSK
ncbi:MAG: thiamine diphosphokinase [Chloroflexota bacterium]